MTTVKQGIVYALLFDTCQVYIGSTTMTMQQRMGSHRYSAWREKIGASPVYRLWRAVGEPTPYVLLRCPVSELLARESQAIREYGTLGVLNVLASGAKHTHRIRRKQADGMWR